MQVLEIALEILLVKKKRGLVKKVEWWWRSAVNFSFFLCLAACRMRSSACDTVPQLCARPVLCWLAFPLASTLGSTGSAADRSALFVGFPATVAEF